MSRLLTPQEHHALDRALATRTRKKVRAGKRPLTVAQGIALWDAAAPLEQPAHAHRRGRPLLATGTVLAASVSLGACATLGGNIKGDFACRAPDGICAPTSTIDDAALAMISGDGTSAQPAGPYSPSPDVSSRTTLSAASPKRSGEKVLRIVFPAHVDGAGRFRESSAVHAVVERGAWLTANATAVAPVRTPADDMPTARPVDTSSLIRRSLSELAAAAPEVRFPDPLADSDAQMAIVDVAQAASHTSDIARVAPARGKSAQVTASAPLPRVAYSGTLERAVPTRAGVASASVGSGTGGAIGAGAVPSAAAAAVSYSLPPKRLATDGAATTNPMDAIRAQVAAQLGKARPVSGPPAASPLASATAPLNVTGTSAAEPGVKPANAPSLFPVSEVNR